MNKVYEGQRTNRGCVVTVRKPGDGGRPVALRPRHDLRNHSPAGFEWGYMGSGPAQLALALLADALADDERALAVYQDFKRRTVGRWEGDSFQIRQDQILWIVSEVEAEKDKPLPDGVEPAPDLGTCCICSGAAEVRNVIMLPKKSPTRGAGWGCLVCGLAEDGAIAVLCDCCLEDWQAERKAIAWACRARPGELGRVPAYTLRGRHEHDLSKHVGDGFTPLEGGTS